MQLPKPVLVRLTHAYLALACYGAVLALLLPSRFDAMPPVFVDFVRLLEAAIPMISRVAAYGHPAPEKMKAMLALLWTAVPVVTVALWRLWDKVPPYGDWRRSKFRVGVRFLLAIPVSGSIIFWCWFWPNVHPSSVEGLLGELNRGVSRDPWRNMFWSTWAIVTTSFIWVSSVASAIDAIVGETKLVVSGLRGTEVWI